MIRLIIGKILVLEAILLLFPCLIAVIYHECTGWYYLIDATICLGMGALLTLKKPSSYDFYLKEGCVATSLGWLVLSFMGCLPFYISGEIPHFIDALFEIVSGFTTTGSSILNDVETLSHCGLMWRSFTHWIGGMGILVFLLGIVSMGGGSMNLMKAESPGPSVGKLVPRVRSTARILYLIYIALTMIMIVVLCICGMPLFDSLTTTFGTAGTGGFGIKNSSLAGYAPHLQWIVAFFMIIFGVNFNVYYLILFHNVKKAFRNEEVRCYLGIIAAATTFITVQLLPRGKGGFDALTKAFFQVASIITSTGFVTDDFDLWSQSSRFVLVLLMFIGACAGSTGGGLKVSRVLLLFKTIKRELMSYIHPRSVKKIQMDGASVEHETLSSVQVYFATFICIFTLSVFLVSFEKDTDLVTSFTASITTLNNIGPGLSLAGPTENFSNFSVLSKIVFIFNMLAGRLELIPVLILFHPGLWKQYFRKIQVTHQKRG